MKRLWCVTRFKGGELSTVSAHLGPFGFYFAPPNKVSSATDCEGRRYGDSLWLFFYLGRRCLILSPGYLRREKQ